MFKTEAEAWEAIADTLEMIEGMPEWGRVERAGGLCEVLGMIWGDGLINTNIFLKMFDRIKRALGPATWLAIKGDWQTRATIARQFAEQAR